jgi:hypothetical protein
VTESRNVIAAAVSVVAGILLIVSSTHGPVGTYEFVLNKLPSLVSDQTVLTVARTIALVLIGISLLGGFVLFLSAFLIYKNHGRTGRLLIGLGTGAGIPWLILILLTFATSKDASIVLAQYSTLGWIGILMALAARCISR